MIDDAFFNKSLQATWIKIYLMQKLLLGNGKPSSISNLEHIVGNPVLKNSIASLCFQALN